MTRPRRASTAKTRTRSPEPRRAALWTITNRGAIHDWACLLCRSATGQASAHDHADQAASTHWMSHHSNVVATP